MVLDPKLWRKFLKKSRDIINFYKKSPIISIIKIKQIVNECNVTDRERFSFKTINEFHRWHRKRQMTSTQYNKSLTLEPPRFIKRSTELLTPLLTNAVSTSIKQSIVLEHD